MLRADEMLRISAGLVFLIARSGGFDDRFQFHSGVAKNTVDISSSSPIQFRVVISEPRRDTTSTRSNGGHTMFGRSVCQLRAEPTTHTTCCSCVRCSDASPTRRSRRPSSSRNLVQFLGHPVLALDDEVHTLQQNVRTQASLQRRFFCMRYFVCSSRLPQFKALRQWWLVLRRDTWM